MANRTLRLLFVCTMLFTLLTVNIAMAETVVDIYVGDVVTTIIEDDDSTSGYYYESTIEGSAGYFTEASRTIDIWTDGPSVDKFAVTDEWAGGNGYINIDTFFDSDGYTVEHFLSVGGFWFRGMQSVSNEFGVDDSDLWIDNRMSMLDGGIYIDTDYMSDGKHLPNDAKADFDVELGAEELWFRSHGKYSDDKGGLEYLSAHAWGAYDMKIGVEDIKGIPPHTKFEDYEFEFTAQASSPCSEAYIRFYDFSVTPYEGCTQDYFSVLLDVFWSNMYGDPEAHIYANGDHGLEGTIETSIGPPTPFMVINGWLKGW